MHFKNKIKNTYLYFFIIFYLTAFTILKQFYLFQMLQLKVFNCIINYAFIQIIKLSDFQENVIQGHSKTILYDRKTKKNKNAHLLAK